MDKDQLDKLYQYLGRQFAELEAKIDAEAEDRREQVSQVQSTADAIYKRLDDLEVEQAAMKHHQARQDGWHQQAADKLGLTLDYS